MTDHQPPKTCPVKTFDGLSERFKSDHGTLGSWSLVGAQWGVSKSWAYNIGSKGIEPKNPQLRLRLGLPAFIEVPACPTCGQAHTKPHPKPKTLPRSLFDWPPKLLLWALENREVLHG